MKWFVSAGLMAPKKANSQVNRLNRYLNFGLLGLATLASQKYAVQVIHGNFDPPDVLAEQLGHLKAEDDVFLSLPSAYSVRWAQGFVASLRSVNPNVTIICGGRWVLDGQSDRIKALFRPTVVAPGLGEAFIRSRLGLPKKPPGVEIPSLDYSLMEDFRTYQPSIEVGRGCVHSCSFCVERYERRSPDRSPLVVAREMKALSVLYAPLAIRPFLEVALFKPSISWAEEFAREYVRLGLDVRWRASCRADSLTPRKLEILAGAGLRVLDIGLESASPPQLEAMRKTRSSASYLKSADGLLLACSRAGVWAKLNILLFPGETDETLGETLKWLDERAVLVKGISANPLILYPSSAEPGLPAIFAERGARYAVHGQLESEGYADLDVSPSFPHAKAVQVCYEISRKFMTAQDFFDLKSYGYFSPALKFEDFLLSAIADTPDSLPFRWR